MVTTNVMFAVALKESYGDITNEHHGIQYWPVILKLTQIFPFPFSVRSSKALFNAVLKLKLRL
jgi:hypothetical protein